MDAIRVDNLLPFGEKLKPLLNKASISESDMKGILSERGVFIGEDNKKNIIPLLTLSILSPREFENLQSLQKDKEDSVKLRTSSYSTGSIENLNQVIKTNILQDVDMTEESQCYSIATDMTLHIKDKNKMILEYTLDREDITKDWASTESSHEGRVEIVREDNKLSFYNQYTSSETEDVNKKVIKFIADNLKSSGVIQNKQEMNITADSFNNQQRFDFMLNLLRGSKSKKLKYKSLVNLEIGIDRTCKISDSIKWIGDEVKNVIINSEDKQTLQNIEYITNKDYHSVLKIRTIKAIYIYDIDGAKGNCIIEFGFPSFFRKYAKNNEFEMVVNKLYKAKENKEHSERKSSLSILSEFNTLVMSAFENIDRA